jgi:ssDNA-binding Zn-finger/Zn-ribbon topoisomerase 1
MKSIPRCPRCFARLVLQKSRLISYLTCPNYPACKRPVYLLKKSSTVNLNECCRAA